MLSQNNRSKVEALHIEHDHFLYLLGKMTIWLLGILKAGVFASPPLRDHYVWGSEGLDNTGTYFRPKCVKLRDPLLDLIDALTDWTMVSRWGLHNLLDKLEELGLSEKSTSERQEATTTHLPTGDSYLIRPDRRCGA